MMVDIQTENEFSSLSREDLDSRISAAINSQDSEGLISLIMERSRRLGFSIEHSLERILEAARRNKFLAFGEIPDQLERSWSKRRHKLWGHLDDLILYCHAKELPVLPSMVVNLKNTETGLMEPGTIKGLIGGLERAGYSINDPQSFVKDQQQLCFEYAAKPDSLISNSSKTGEDWSEDELDAIIDSYFSMLKTEVADDPYKKSEHRTQLMEAIDRSSGAIEFKLGVIYTNGDGVPQDYVEAHKWFNLAAATGYKDAIKERGIVARKMTPAQIAEAQRLAREWKPKK